MIYIVDIFRDIVATVSENLTVQLQSIDGNITGVHYLTGHYTEIKERLASKANSITQKLDRYPLVCLFQDFVEDCDNDSGFEETQVQLMIVHNTKKEAYNEDRYTTVVKPILAPIYTELLSQISCNRNFIITGRVKHKRIIRLNWGNPGKYGNEGVIFNDVLDGIELRNTRLKVQEVCSTMRLK